MAKEDEYREALAEYNKAREYWENYLARLSGQAKAEGCSHPPDLLLSYEDGDDYASYVVVSHCRVCGAERRGKYAGSGEWTYGPF